MYVYTDTNDVSLQKVGTNGFTPCLLDLCKVGSWLPLCICVIDQASSVKMAGYCPLFLFAFL